MQTTPSHLTDFVRQLGEILAQALPPPALARINWAVVTAAAKPALAAGWPPADLACRAVIGAATGDNPGALLVSNLRALAGAAPPTGALAVSGPHARSRVTSPRPWPECARCAQPIRPGDHPHECPACGVQLRLVVIDYERMVSARGR